MFFFYPIKKDLIKLFNTFNKDIIIENFVLYNEVLKKIKINKKKLSQIPLHYRNYLLKNLFYSIIKNKNKKRLEINNIINNFYSNSINFKKKIYFLKKNLLLDQEVKLAFHPKKKKLRVEFAKYNLIKKRYINSFKIFNKLAVIKYFIYKVVENVVPLKNYKETSSSEFLSFSSKNINSTIFVSGLNPILIAENIVHESTHNYLNVLEIYNKMYKKTLLRIRTPLRKDRRPIRGLLHQMFVLNNLVYFYRKILTLNSISHIKKNKNAIIKRYELIKNDLETAKKIYLNYRNHFTAYSNKIVKKAKLI